MTQYHPLLWILARSLPTYRNQRFGDHVCRNFGRRIALVGSSCGSLTMRNPGIVKPSPPGASNSGRITSPQDRVDPAAATRVVNWRSAAKCCIALTITASEAAALVPPEIRTPVFVGPLTNDEGPTGAIVMVAATGAVLNESNSSCCASCSSHFQSRWKMTAAARTKRVARRRGSRSTIAPRTSGPQRDSRDNRRRRLGLVHVMERVELVAQSDVPVLILGGDGHGQGSRLTRDPPAFGAPQGPFLRVNCGAIPPSYWIRNSSA